MLQAIARVVGHVQQARGDMSCGGMMDVSRVYDEPKLIRTLFSLNAHFGPAERPGRST